MRTLAALPIAIAIVTPAAETARGESEPRPELRVCADPNNMPFSNARGDGF